MDNRFEGRITKRYLTELTLRFSQLGGLANRRRSSDR